MGRMNVKKIPLVLISILIGAIISNIVIPQAKAGSGGILPFSIQNTTLQASFTYPDNIQISEGPTQNSFNVSVAFSVIFQNSSIQRVNVTEVDVFVEDVNANLTSIANDGPYSENGFIPNNGSGSLWTSDDFTNPIGTLTPAVDEITFKPISVYCGDSEFVRFEIYGPSEVRLFVEIWLRILNLNTVTNQQIVSLPSGTVRNVTLPYRDMALYTGEGESPIITITTTAPNQPNFTIYLFIIIVAVCILAIVSGIILYKRNKRNERKAEIQTETSPTTKKEG
jgi:hypothetical protein